jgi:RNA polymerase sigma-70 factor (ECF subfamily)
MAPSSDPLPLDADLMASLAEGDGEAFRGLCDRWRPRIVNFARALGADPDEAEDTAQEALIRVYRYRHDYRPTAPFGAFVFTLARRSFLDLRRTAARRREVGPPCDADEGLDPPSRVRGASAEDRLDLAAAVARLPRRLREVVEWGAIRGLPYEQVAVLLGVPVGTVKSRMHHAVRRLREALGDGAPDGRTPGLLP